MYLELVLGSELEWENRKNEKKRSPSGLIWLSEKSGWFLLYLCGRNWILRNYSSIKE